MQSILGALLTAGYAGAMAATIAAAPAQTQDNLTSGIDSQLQKSFDGAKTIADQYPQYSEAILNAARDSFLHGANWAYFTGIVMMLIGLAIAFFLYPKHTREMRLIAGYNDSDSATTAHRTDK